MGEIVAHYRDVTLHLKTIRPSLATAVYAGGRFNLRSAAP